MSETSSLILASGSEVRARLLTSAGVAFRVVPSDVDETPLKTEGLKEARPLGEIAARLAAAKARSVAAVEIDSVVIGADQILECGGRGYDKPADMTGAAVHLRALRGKTHLLHTAVCVVRGEDVIWESLTTPELTMRDFSDDFIDEYLVAAGPAVLSSVGAYLLEGRGSQLFSEVKGDFFTILGLPLLAVLQFLRDERLISS